MSDNSDKRTDRKTDKWRNVSEASDLLGVSKRTIERRIHKGEIESKLENGRRLVLLPTADRQERQTDADMSQAALIEQLQSEVEYLRQQLSESRERSDTIILQLTRQLEQSQRLLEYHQSPWWRRWFSRKRETKE